MAVILINILVSGMKDPGRPQDNGVILAVYHRIVSLANLALVEQGGGILQVGGNLAKALREKGFVVNHIREPHTPHDAGAYQRSRRTAQELVTEGDQLIFDVHRDAKVAAAAKPRLRSQYSISQR